MALNAQQKRACAIDVYCSDTFTALPLEQLVALKCAAMIDQGITDPCIQALAIENAKQGDFAKAHAIAHLMRRQPQQRAILDVVRVGTDALLKLKRDAA